LKSEAETPSLQVEAAAEDSSVLEPAAISVPDTAAVAAESSVPAVPLEEMQLEAVKSPLPAESLDAEAATVKAEPEEVAIKTELGEESAAEMKKEEEEEAAKMEEGETKGEGETEIKTEGMKVEKEEEEEKKSANNSLILDVETGSQGAVLQPQQKVSLPF